MKDKRFTESNCNHNWLPFFEEKIDHEKDTMRVGACIVCAKCGMFRTKVLEFRFPEKIKGV